MLVDTHCHLDSFLEAGTLQAVLERAGEADVQQVITIGTRPADWPLHLELVACYPGQVYATVGLHPGYVGPDWAEALALQKNLLDKNPKGVVALGEIGLDYFRLPENDPHQKAKIQAWQDAAFRHQIQEAKRRQLPIVIHARAAFEATCRVLEEEDADWPRVVFHCFSEGPEAIHFLRQRGARASFTGIVSYKNAHLTRQALCAHGLKDLMVETDAPWLAPQTRRGQTNEPAWVREVAIACAEALQVSFSELCVHTTQNAQHFFGLA